MPYSYQDSFVQRLAEDIRGLVVDGAGDANVIEAKLHALTCANSPAVRAYWARTRPGFGVPDTAFKGALGPSPYLFPDQPPARTFRTSGTSGAGRGEAHCSPLGMELMDLSILASARRRVTAGLDRPVIIRFVPAEAMAPDMVMAHGMEVIAGRLGHPGLSACVVRPSGVDFGLLTARLDAAVAAEIPVVLIGGSFAFVNICDALEARGARWVLPVGSRMVDAGGFKGRSRTVDVDTLRSSVARTFGVAPGACVNLFGMTELASQLYDGEDRPAGPLGERPKANEAFVRAQVRDAHSLEVRSTGPGLLEVVDLCILDRPCTILTGDRGIAGPMGVAVAGRVERGQSRGCSLSLDGMTGGGR